VSVFTHSILQEYLWANAAVKRARGATRTKNAESFLESTRFLNSAQGEWGC